ncbi:MAG: EFR1 family ferrodoxin [Duncaniella sp.]|nr:EFR1 family ferrodoxin [Duncaniella sp.]
MIVYFSGTGNSRAVAKTLAGLLDEKVSFIFPAPDLSGEERVIWVTPVYSWGLPPVMVDAIRSAVCKKGSRHFLVATHGDDLGNTHRQWRRIISEKGLDPVAAYSVTMPNTYVSLPFFDVDSPEVEKAKLEAMPRRVDEIALMIRGEKRCDDVVRGAFPGFKSSVIYPVFIRKALSAKPFRVNDRCTSCHKCERECPMQNITFTDGRPVWHDNCAGCLGCYHICPVHAIDRGSATRHKGQYYYPAHHHQGK